MDGWMMKSPFGMAFWHVLFFCFREGISYFESYLNARPSGSQWIVKVKNGLSSYKMNTNLNPLLQGLGPNSYYIILTKKND